ncbi:MAG: hypothetical protein BWY91_03310 [bacterium ADurb.BinA028]|nr:MAG: hypothetical protein BWY91_03310 [bacterium ADurb.BinA028]
MTHSAAARSPGPWLSPALTDGMRMSSAHSRATSSSGRMPFAWLVVMAPT